MDDEDKEQNRERAKFVGGRIKLYQAGVSGRLALELTTILLLLLLLLANVMDIYIKLNILLQ